jgi:hypothetical protein
MPQTTKEDIAYSTAKTTTKVTGDLINTTANIGIKSADIFLSEFIKEKERYEKRNSSNKSTKPCLQSQRLINMNRY